MKNVNVDLFQLILWKCKAGVRYMAGTKQEKHKNVILVKFGIVSLLFSKQPVRLRSPFYG